MPSDVVAQPRPAATVILLRDGADGPEVYVIRRHDALAFAGGATVFPGGRIDPADGDPAWADLCPGTGDDHASRIAAIRETFEECGLLLARPAGGGPLIDEAAVTGVRARSGWGGESGCPPFLEQMRREGLELAADRLLPFARWQTPEWVHRRFDTLFFLAAAPPGQTASFDRREAVEGLWATPRALLARADAGTVRLVFATRMNLMRLTAFGSVAEALAAAGRRPIRPILPRRVDTPAGPVLRIPVDAGYDPAELPVELVRLG
ncbi:NUDIX domain-containing protein [Azospirillum sp. RWY-5-1]|uniref:NUDIX domain-containing protein n=1 Tax=Azospirillum oleiclasticum TaxID=2735135 RepID=A0ABX2TAZ4_9PROT|nr:NUDIX domain-containing protein [Azospirillum oleiclasticum]NYZ21465.1 NUDIX domain-containing protein [Azospirillum oleiclasticum]